MSRMQLLLNQSAQNPWFRRLFPYLLAAVVVGVAFFVYSNNRSKAKRTVAERPFALAASKPVGVQAAPVPTPGATRLAAGEAVPLLPSAGAATGAATGAGAEAADAPPLAPMNPGSAGGTGGTGAVGGAGGSAPQPPPGSLAEAMRQPSNAMGCLIEASATAEVGTPVVGIIERVLVERGDRVKRGQVLAHHDNRMERAALLVAEQKVANNAELRAAKSQSVFANRKAERTAELTTQNYVSGQAREQADTEAQLARMRLAQAVEQRQLALKELELARAQLQQRTITSPISGVVVDRLVSAGERVENRPIFRIAQVDPLRVEVVLPSSQFGHIAVGAKARVTPDLPGSAVHEARVSIVDPVVDAASNTFRARLSLPNPTHKTPAGLRCRVEFMP